MRVENFLQESARRSGDKIGLVCGDVRLSYAELDAASDRLATTLLGHGFQPGERAIVFMGNTWQAVVAIFAILKAGGVFCPVNPSTKADKLAYIAGNCRASVILTHARLLDVARTASAPVPSLALTIVSDAKDVRGSGIVRFEDAIRGNGRNTAHDPGIELDLAMLIYTSGSTGFPKGVMMTHQSVVAAATSITTYLENTEDDIVLSALPISFDYGLYQVLMAAQVGARLVLERSFAFPRVVLDRMAAEGVTGFPIVPTMAGLILQMKDLSPGFQPSLRYLTNTAAALPPSFISRLRDLFPGARLYSMYGLTECKRCTWLPPEELDRRPTSVGIAIPGTEAFVVREDNVRAAPGEIGELVVRGPHVMKGYWENPEATARALRPGHYPWETVLHTGDLFRTDEEGFLYFVGRTDDIIKTRGEKVAPKEVESVIYALDGVREAVVLGAPDPILGEIIKAVVATSDPSLTEKDIVRHCARYLEDFMVPKEVEICDELPKTDTGKLSRRLVAEAMEPAL